MGFRKGLEHTNSFERLWETLMCHIALKFQDKNYFLKILKINARMMRAAEQELKHESRT